MASPASQVLALEAPELSLTPLCRTLNPVYPQALLNMSGIQSLLPTSTQPETPSSPSWAPAVESQLSLSALVSSASHSTQPLKSKVDHVTPPLRTSSKDFTVPRMSVRSPSPTLPLSPCLLTRLQPFWFCDSLKMPSTLPPQGVCSCPRLRLKRSSTDIHGSLPGLL